ncbi:cytochrome P450 oxidoreductase [Xylariomycetidae sp. FL2044]|nr:cytochrome P450 oxidoreductase [Xylariomycetidae sp. FL2044]
MAVFLVELWKCLPPQSFVYVLFTSILYFLAWTIYARSIHPFRSVPGPWAASVTPLWYMMYVARGDFEATQRDLHKKYGPLVRVAPDEISCASPDAIKLIYRTRYAFNKTNFYSVFNSESFSRHHDVFTEVDDEKHAKRKRIVNYVYILSNVLKSEAYITKCSDLLIERLGEFADASTPCDLGRWLQWFSFDVVGELSFGRMFGFLEKKEDYRGWIRSLDTILPFLCIMGVAPPYLRPMITASALVVPASRKALEAASSMGVAARDCVAQRFANEARSEHPPRVDLLGQLYSICQEKGAEVDFQMGDIEQESWVALTAGSDTIAITLRAVFYYLMKHPGDYDTLMSEVDAATKDGRLSSPVRYCEAIQLPFLCACIKESFRIHPGVQLPMGRVVGSDGLELCGVYIPQGYRVGMNSAVVHFDTSIFGLDASQFRPSRWLESVEKSSRMEQHMLHFGAGTRTCIGKSMALV